MNKLCIFLLTLMLLLSGCTKSSVGNGEDPLGDDVKNAEVGDVITFGSYEQDDNTSNGKEAIEWIVLARENDRVLVVSKYCLDTKPYNEVTTDVTWETCSLRTWLNTEFYNEAFTSEEQSKIITTTVSADKNPEYNTNPGNDTQDKVFLLSIVEVKMYFKIRADRVAKPTKYAENKGVYVCDDGSCYWWLRSPGSDSFYAADVADDGSIPLYGYYVDNVLRAVRPALWLEIDN